MHQFEGAVTLQEPLEIDSQADVQQKVSDNKSDKKEGLKEEKNVEKLQKTSKVGLASAVSCFIFCLRITIFKILLNKTSRQMLYIVVHCVCY